MTEPPATPAATLVVFRDPVTGTAPELLFVERAATMAFAGGAIVFPGGRVDAGDHRIAERLDRDDALDTAARIAAIRETIEEAGVAIGVRGLDAAGVARVRAHLADGTPFADALAAAHATLDVDALVPFARWRPNLREMRTFDTRFYLAALPADAATASVDATENVRLFWATAQSVLNDADAGHVRVIFPTRRNLERLALFGDFAAARAQAEAIAPELIAPWIEDRDGEPYLCIPANRGYPVCAERMASVARG